MPFTTFDNLPEEKRQIILDVAMREFAENDYASASISKIVARAGIAKGSLYQYFADKRDLYHYLLDLGTQKKAEMLAGVNLLEPGMPLFDLLRHLFVVMAEFEFRYPLLAKIGYRAVNGKSPLPEDILLKAKQSTRQYFVALLEQGKQRGEVRSEVDPVVAAMIFTATLTELGNIMSTRSGDSQTKIETDEEDRIQASEIEQAYNQIVSILQNGIAEG
jgi:AcrR family transcriptional regulator